MREEGERWGAGLHKVVILIIQDNSNSHFSQNLFSWKSCINGQKTYFWQTKFLSQKQVTVTEKKFSDRRKFRHIKKSLCHRRTLLSEKNFLQIASFRDRVFVKVSYRETHFCNKKSITENFFHRQKFLSEKKASLTEASRYKLKISRHKAVFTKRKMYKK